MINGRPYSSNAICPLGADMTADVGTSDDKQTIQILDDYSHVLTRTFSSMAASSRAVRDSRS